MAESITASPTFRARVVHAELHRAWVMGAIWALSMATLILRRLEHGAVVAVDALYYTSLGILAFGVLFEAATIPVLKRSSAAGASTRGLSIVSAAVELAVVLGLMGALEAWSPVGHFGSLSAPVILGFPIVILMSVLRLKPWLSLGVGLGAALGHAAFSVYVIRANDVDRHLWAMLFQYATLLAFTGGAAAMVAQHARRSLIEAVGDALVAERTERALAVVERDMAVAQEIQAGLMPSVSPAISGFDVAGMARPAAKAGGDFYDWQPMADGRLVVALADVTGHGIGPALVMAVCRSYSRASAPSAPDPATLISRINELIYEDLSRTGRFITMAIAIAHPSGEVELVSAGHGPTLLYRAASGEVEVFGGDGVPLGVLEGEQYGPARRFRMERGDVLMLMTDGFMEWARADGKMFGLDGLRTSVQSAASGTAREILGRLDAAAVAFAAGAEQQDDTTAVAIKRVG